ncbi:MAG: AsmA family protein [Burkholderiales bacterium]|nr:AsmA family protein [Burkholderiales bacterium]
MKILKWTAFVIGGLVLLVVVGLAILVATFDPNKYKDDITRLVRESKQRTLTIGGSITLKVFPKIGIEVGQVSLSEFKSDKQFVKLDRAKLYVDLLPLLRKELIVDRIEIDGLAANIVRGKDGKFNFDDLLSKDEKKDEQVKFDVEGIKLAGAAISYRDEASGQTASLDQMSLATGRIADKVPSRIDLTARVQGARPAVSAQVAIAGGILFDLDRKTYAFSNLEAKAAGSARQAPEKGKAAFDLAGLDARISAGDLRIDASTLAIDAQKLALEARGTLDREPFDVKLSSPKLTVNGKTQAVAADKVALEAKGRRGSESGSVKLDAARLEADLTSSKFAVDGMSASGSGAMPGMLINDFKAKAPKLVFNPAAGQITLDGVGLTAVGKRGDDAFDVRLDAPKLAVSRDAASGSAVTGSVKLTGRDIVDARFNLGEVKGTAKALSVGRIAVEIAQAKFGANTVSGSVTTSLNANLEARQFDLPRVSADLTLANPEMPMKSVKLPVAGSVRADLGRENVTADLSTKFDESAIQAKVGVARFKNAAISFDLAIDRLNVDKYFPPKPPPAPGAPRPAEPDKPIDLAGLKALNASGTVKVGQLQVNNVKASNVSLVIKAAGGRLDVNPINAGLYQGTLAGSASVNANSNSFALRQTLTGVNINPLMRDAINKDILEGRGNIVLDLTASGNTATALKKALNGSTSIVLRDGAYKGINLAKSFREAKAAVSLNKSKIQEARKEDRTDFTEMKVSAQIVNGIARSDDLDAKSPFLRLGGAGTVDIPGASMDYLAKATVVNTSGGQDAKDLAQLKGLTVPVRINGPLDALKYDVQYGAIAGSVVTEKVKDSVKDRLGERLGITKPQAAPAPGAPGQPAPAQPAPQSPQDKAREKLRGLLGR